jgi:hypothetical protein
MQYDFGVRAKRNIVKDIITIIALVMYHTSAALIMRRVPPAISQQLSSHAVRDIKLVLELVSGRYGWVTSVCVVGAEAIQQGRGTLVKRGVRASG